MKFLTKIFLIFSFSKKKASLGKNPIIEGVVVIREHSTFKMIENLVLG